MPLRPSLPVPIHAAVLQPNNSNVQTGTSGEYDFDVSLRIRKWTTMKWTDLECAWTVYSLDIFQIHHPALLIDARTLLRTVRAAVKGIDNCSKGSFGGQFFSLHIWELPWPPEDTATHCEESFCIPVRSTYGTSTSIEPLTGATGWWPHTTTFVWEAV